MGERFLEGRTALVTGSTSGIGLAIAQALGAAGANVAVNGLGSHEQVEAAVASVCSAGSPKATFLAADLSDPAAVESMMKALDAWGPADIVVNCAGVQHVAPIGDMPAATWDKLIAINLSAAFHTMRLSLPGMVGRGFGRVLNIASVHGLVASVNKSPYVASKFGLVGLSKVAALECAGAGSRDSGGVTINCVCPGWVETPLIEPQIAARVEASGGDRDAGIRAMLAEKQPSGRMSLPADIAATVLFLCRREAHNITGTAIPVDGGWTSQ